MLERYFVKPATIDRIRGSWLAPEIERYVEWMASQGYALRNFYRRVPILCRFAEFAKLHRATDAKSAAAHVEAICIPLAGQPWISRWIYRSQIQGCGRSHESCAADAALVAGGSCRRCPYA